MISCSSSPKKEEKKFGVKVCRERKCPDLRKDTEGPYPDDSQERCYALGVDHHSMMPGTLSCCIKDLDNMPPEQFLRHVIWSLRDAWEKKFSGSRKTPGVKNCPAACPYKISEEGKVRDRSKKEDFYAMKNGLIWRCIFTGEVLGQGMSASCPCHILDNPDLEVQIEALKFSFSSRTHIPFNRRECHTVGCPDGIGRCKQGDIICPVIKIPFVEIKECPLWRIPAKMLPEVKADPVVSEKPTAPDTIVVPSPEEMTQMEKTPSRKSAQEENLKKEEPAKKARKAKKELEDPICEDCRTRHKGPVEEWQCTDCRRIQQKYGRRGWTTLLQMGQVHLGDMEQLGEQVPSDSVDVICTDPPYILELWENAYAHLGEMASRVLKPYGFLFTYAPNAHLDEIMEMLGRSGNGSLRYFWSIQSLNSGPAMKAHKWNALCLHKQILVFQKVPEGSDIRAARRCFADVVRGFKQKRYHKWQQSVHDVLGILDRFMVPGEILLDPYAGTGTSLIAGNLLGMDWIGFELDPNTHAIAVRELQQQPMDLFTFGGEEPEPPQVREAIEAPKDTSKQAAIDTVPLKGPGRKCTDNACHVGEYCEERIWIPVGPDSCIDKALKNFHQKYPKGKSHYSPRPEEHCDTCEYPQEGKPLNETCPNYGDVKKEHECIFRHSGKKKDQDPDAISEEDTVRLMTTLHSCDHWKPPLPKNEAPPTVSGGPTPGTCGTCGHHKGRKTFYDSCPRLGELLFKGGTKSAKVLIEETQVDRCEHWTGPIPYDQKTAAKGPRDIFEEGHEKNVSLKGFKKDTPEWFTALTASKRGSCPGWHWEIWKSDPKKNAEWLYEGARTEKEAHGIRDQLQRDKTQEGCTFEVRKRPDTEVGPDLCTGCQITDCTVFDSLSPECLLFHPEVRGINKKIPNITWCSTDRNCKSLSWEDGICTTTGKKVKEMTYCPTQHLVGKQPKKKPESEKSNCGGKRPAISRCPDNCPDKSIEKEGGYPQGRCKQTGEKLREMQVCPNDPPNAEKKAGKKIEKPLESVVPFRQFLNEHHEQIVTGKDLPIVPQVVEQYKRFDQTCQRSLKLFISDGKFPFGPWWTLSPSGKLRSVKKPTGDLHQGESYPDCRFRFEWHYDDKKKED